MNMKNKILKKTFLPVLLAICIIIPLARWLEARQTTPDLYENYLTINYFLNLNQFARAEALIDRHLEAHPDDPFILSEKALLSQKLRNDPDTAIKLLEKARKIYPGYYYSNFLLASSLFYKYPENKEQVNKAIHHLEMSIKDNDRFFDSLYLLGLIMSDRGDYKASNLYFEKCIRLDEKLEVYYYMASNYRRLRDEDGEITIYNKILENQPNDYKALTTLSQIHSNRNNYKKAVIYLEKLWDQYPENREITEDYLYALFASGQDEKFMHLSGTIDIKSSRVLIYARALILSRRKQYDEAIKYMGRLNPKDARSFLMLSEIYMQKQDYFTAYQNLDKVEAGHRNHLYYSLKLQTLAMMNLNRRIVDLFEQLKQNKTLLKKLNVGDFYSILFSLARLNRLEDLKKAVLFIQDDLGIYSEMFTHLSEILKDFSPRSLLPVNKTIIKFPANIYLLMTFYKNSEQYKLGINAMDSVIQLEKPVSPDPYLEKCDIYLKQKRYKRVENSLQAASQAFPDSAQVKNFFAYYLALRGKRLSFALKLSANTLEKDPENPAYLDTYGYILFKMGQLAKAGKHLKKAYQKIPLDEEIIEHMADYYRAKKTFHRIADLYKQAIDNGVDFKEKMIKKLEQFNSSKK